MKKELKISRSATHLLTLFLLVVANIVSYSGSLFLFGEPKPPKSLLK